VIGQLGTFVGLGVAATAPILGATMDKYGPRKPWIMAFVLCMAPLLSALWWARPDGSGLGVGAILAVLGVTTAIGGLSDVVFNSMIHLTVGRERVAKASGLAFSCAYIVGIMVLGAVLWAFELPGQMASPYLPAHPLLGLSAADGGPKRIVGPIAAGLWLIFSLPLLLFARDGERTGRSLGDAAREGIGSLGQLVRSAKSLNRDLALFLIARVAYYDAMVAYVMVNGVYAAGVMGWRGAQLLVYGILTAACGVVSGLVSQALDHWLGPRRAVLCELMVLSAFVFAQVGTSPTRILYLPVGPGGPVTPGAAFLAFGLGAAVTLPAAFASTRTLLARLAPQGELGAVVGLAALMGSSTAWFVPLMIATLTSVFHSQQAGFVPLFVMMLLGALALSLVRDGGRWRPGVDEDAAPLDRLSGA
jgi:UMF1 family MFS transporter